MVFDSFMQVPNSDFYNISVAGAHKGFSTSSSVPHYPSSSYQITKIFYESTSQHNLDRPSLRYMVHNMHVWYIGTRVV